MQQYRFQLICKNHLSGIQDFVGFLSAAKNACIELGEISSNALRARFALNAFLREFGCFFKEKIAGAVDVDFQKISGADFLRPFRDISNEAVDKWLLELSLATAFEQRVAAVQLASAQDVVHAMRNRIEGGSSLVEDAVTKEIVSQFRGLPDDERTFESLMTIFSDDLIESYAGRCAPVGVLNLAVKLFSTLRDDEKNTDNVETLRKARVIFTASEKLVRSGRDNPLNQYMEKMHSLSRKQDAVCAHAVNLEMLDQVKGNIETLLDFLQQENIPAGSIVSIAQKAFTAFKILPVSEQTAENLRSMWQSAGMQQAFQQSPNVVERYCRNVRKAMPRQQRKIFNSYEIL